MTHWGVGPRFGFYMVPYCILMVVISLYLDPLFKITFIPYHALATTGIILILMGIPFYVISLNAVMRAFKAGSLITNGVYGMCRHPVYSAWIVFYIPGIMLLINTWLGLTAPFVLYFVLITLVKEEDIFLEKTYGDTYLDYKQSVPAVFPIGWLRSKA